MKKRVLVTGANGFVGRRLCQSLARKGVQVFGASRGGKVEHTPGLTQISVEALGPETDWSECVSPDSGLGQLPVDCVIHCSALAHVRNDDLEDLELSYRQTNVQGALRLAECSLQAGVKHFVFLSSANVHGRETLSGIAFSEKDAPAPEGLSGLSKWEAEQALWRLCKGSAMSLTVVRLPLVYGPGVKGNMARLMNAVSRGFPIPLGRIDNQRSMIGLGNLVHFLSHCILNPKASNKTFLIADDVSHSTKELVRLMAAAMDKKIILLPVPIWLLHLLGRLIGKKSEINRLAGSFCIDDSFARAELGWKPHYSAEQGIREMAADFLRVRNVKHD